MTRCPERGPASDGAPQCVLDLRHPPTSEHTARGLRGQVVCWRVAVR